MGLLGCPETARFLDQCNADAEAIREVLEVCASRLRLRISRTEDVLLKLARGYRAEAVFTKLRCLCEYLHSTGRRPTVLTPGAHIILDMVTEVRAGGQSSREARTEAGRAVWNVVRRSKWGKATEGGEESSAVGGLSARLAEVRRQAEERSQREAASGAWNDRSFISKSSAELLPVPPGYDRGSLPSYAQIVNVRM